VISNPHNTLTPSPWVAHWAHLVAARGQVLDVACGHGRHLAFFAQRGHPVTGVDQSAQALLQCPPSAQTLCADLENAPWPLLHKGLPRQFDAVVVTNYLWRALFPVIAQSLAPGGVLIYETFAAGNETVGKPSRPDFLLKPGELLTAFPSLRTVAFEDGFTSEPDRFVQRIVAVREQFEPAASPTPARHLLQPKVAQHSAL
jgi:SAM-dependent methyltransferase